MRALELALVVTAAVIVLTSVIRRARSIDQQTDRFYAEPSWEQERVRAKEEFLDALRGAACEITADLEAKADSIRNLLREADETIVSLAELLARSEQIQQSAPSQLDPAPTPQRVGEPEKALQSGSNQRLAGATDPHQERIGRPAAYRQVHLLAKEGKRPEEIAKQLGMGTGEVLLVLGLSQKS